MYQEKLFLILLILSLVLALTDWRIHFQTPRDFTLRLFQPMLVGLHEIGLQSFQGVDFLGDLPKVYEENQNLKLKLSQQSFLEIDNQRLGQENEALRNQLSIQEFVEQSLLPAQVLGQISQGVEIFLIVNKGKKDGVSSQGSVVLEKNLIGRLTQVYDHYSYLEPIFSSKAKFRVGVGKNLSEGVVVGELNTRVKLTEVLQESEIGAGDAIVTTGSEGIFPPGLVVGKLKKVEKKDWEIYQGGEVELSWEPKSLKTVFVIL